MQEFHEGDLVEAVKGETVIRGRAIPHITGKLAPGECTAALSWYEANGFKVTVVEKAAAPLPTEPGWYETRNGGVLYLAKESADYAQRWLDALGEFILPTEVESFAPLARLEPVPVTAKRVLDAIRGRIGSIDSAHDFQAVAARFGVTE